MSLPQPYWQSDGITLYCGDCREVLPSLGFRNGDRCTAVVSDPPYGLADGFEDGGEILSSIAFNVVLPDLEKFVAKRLNRGAFLSPRNRVALLGWMNRSVWEESRVKIGRAHV